MDWRSQVLLQCGYQVLSQSGDYCLAYRDNHDIILKWDGQAWIIV